jgi:hypothetical protein
VPKNQTLKNKKKTHKKTSTNTHTHSKTLTTRTMTRSGPSGRQDCESVNNPGLFLSRLVKMSGDVICSVMDMVMVKSVTDLPGKLTLVAMPLTGVLGSNFLFASKSWPLIFRVSYDQDENLFKKYVS